MNLQNVGDFPKVYLINLERAHDPRHFMEAQFKQYGIEYELFHAIDGKNLSPEQLNLYSAEQSLATNARTLSASEISCALSHIEIYKRFLESGHSECLIFEDDVVIGTEFINVIRNRAKLPRDWEMINFFSDAPERPFGQYIFRKYRASKFTAWANMTAMLFVNRSGAEKLLKAALPLRITADGLTGRTYRTGLKMYGIFPRCVTLRDFGTTQFPDEIKYEKTLLFKIVKKMPRGIYPLLFRLGITK